MFEFYDQHSIKTEIKNSFLLGKLVVILALVCDDFNF